MIVQWYPGHMAKARKMMEQDVKLVDLVIEILDARAPLSSKNPDIDRIAKNKYRMVILNKADLADNKCNDKWCAYFEAKGIKAVLLNARDKDGLRKVIPAVKEVCRAKIEKDAKKGIINQTIKAMVVGIPNVGKSTFINAVAGKNVATTGNKPGVTKGKQWIRLSEDLQLLDTPGILWPKFDDQEIGKRLAYIGSINDEILVREELAGSLLVYLKNEYPDLLINKYHIDVNMISELIDNADRFVTEESVLLDGVAASRGCLKKGGESDYYKAANAVIDDFRSGKIGRITLEKCEGK